MLTDGLRFYDGAKNENLLVPSMTEDQRLKLKSPDVGEIVYQTNNSKGIYYYTGTEWLFFSNGTTDASQLASGQLKPERMPNIDGDVVHSIDNDKLILNLKDITQASEGVNKVDINAKGQIIQSYKVSKIEDLGITNVYNKTYIDNQLDNKLSTSLKNVEGGYVEYKSGGISANNLPTFIGDINHDKSTNELTLKTVATPGVYNSVAINEKGLVTSGHNFTSIKDTSITDVYSKVELDEQLNNVEYKSNKNRQNGYAGLNSISQIDASFLPSITISDTFVTNAEFEQLELSAKIGDVCIRTDIKKSFILSKLPTNDLNNWKELLTPNNGVISINKKSGTIFKLLSTDIDDLAPSATIDTTIANNITQGILPLSVLPNFMGDVISDPNNKNVLRLKTSNIAGTYNKVNILDNGLVASGTNVSKISDLGIDDVYDKSSIDTKFNSYELKSNKNQKNGYAGINSDGFIDARYIPSIAISDTFVIDKPSDITSINAKVGDVVIDPTTNKSYILQGNDPSDANNWKELKTPTMSVNSINGKNGVIGKLEPSDINGLALSATLDTTIAENITSGKLNKDRLPNFSGDVESDTSPNVLKLKSRNVKGDYNYVTVNDAGIVTSGQKITKIALTGIDDVYDKITIDNKLNVFEVKTNRNKPNGYVGIMSDGKIPNDVLPALAISNTFVVDSQNEMLALLAHTGDVCINNTERKTYILSNNDPLNINNWKEMQTPNDGVMSINGKKGTIDKLQPSDINGLASSATVDTTNASNISTGTINKDRLPTFTGDVINTLDKGQLELKSQNITERFYTKVKVNPKGIVIEGSNPTSIDDLGITDVIKKSSIGVKDGIVPLNADNQIDVKFIPASVGGTPSWNNIQNKPTFKNSIDYNVASDSTADVNEIVLGSDSRLSDDRKPLAHNHQMTDINGLSSEFSKYTLSSDFNTTISNLKGNVSSDYDSLKKLYDLVIGQTNEYNVANLQGLNAITINTIPANIFISDVDGNGNWVLYRALETGNAKTLYDNNKLKKISDKGLLNAVMSDETFNVRSNNWFSSHNLTVSDAGISSTKTLKALIEQLLSSVNTKAVSDSPVFINKASAPFFESTTTSSQPLVINSKTVVENLNVKNLNDVLINNKPSALNQVLTITDITTDGLKATWENTIKGVGKLSTIGSIPFVDAIGSLDIIPDISYNNTSKKLFLKDVEVSGNIKFTSYSENLTASIGNTINIDLKLGTLFKQTTNAANVAVNIPNMTVGQSFTLIIKYGVASSILTWNNPNGGLPVKWPDNAPATASEAINSVDIFSFLCDGEFIYAGIAGQNY